MNPLMRCSSSSSLNLPFSSWQSILISSLTRCSSTYIAHWVLTSDGLVFVADASVVICPLGLSLFLNTSNFSLHRFNIGLQVSIISVYLLFKKIVHVLVFVDKLAELTVSVLPQCICSLFMSFLPFSVDVHVVLLSVHSVREHVVGNDLSLHGFNDNGSVCKLAVRDAV